MSPRFFMVALLLVAGCDAPAQPTTPPEQTPVTAAPVVSGNDCVLTLELSQSHFTMDLMEHVKDSANRITLDMPTTCAFANSVNVGDELLRDGFRSGSFWIRGSVWSWHLRVRGKR